MTSTEALSYVQLTEETGHPPVLTSGTLVQTQAVPVLPKGIRMFAKRKSGKAMVNLLSKAMSEYLVEVTPHRTLTRQATTTGFGYKPKVGGALYYVYDGDVIKTKRHSVSHFKMIDLHYESAGKAAVGEISRALERLSREVGDVFILEVNAEDQELGTLLQEWEGEPAHAEPVEARQTLPFDTNASVSKRLELLEMCWPDSAAVGHLLGSTSESNAGQYAARYRKLRKLLGVRNPGSKVFLHPDCQFKDGGLMPEMEDLLAILPLGNGSGWSQAFWLYSPHPLLEGHRPADVFRGDPRRVIAVAKRQFKEERNAGW